MPQGGTRRCHWEVKCWVSPTAGRPAGVRKGAPRGACGVGSVKGHVSRNTGVARPGIMDAEAGSPGDGDPHSPRGPAERWHRPPEGEGAGLHPSTQVAFTQGQGHQAEVTVLARQRHTRCRSHHCMSEGGHHGGCFSLAPRRGRGSSSVSPLLSWSPGPGGHLPRRLHVAKCTALVKLESILALSDGRPPPRSPCPCTEQWQTAASVPVSRTKAATAGRGPSPGRQVGAGALWRQRERAGGPLPSSWT